MLLNPSQKEYKIRVSLFLIDYFQWQAPKHTIIKEIIDFIKYHLEASQLALKVFYLMMSFTNRRFQESGQNPQEGRLAGTVRADDPHDLSRVDAQVDGAQDRHPPEADPDAREYGDGSLCHSGEV